jgi:hypothetical protein
VTDGGRPADDRSALGADEDTESCRDAIYVLLHAIPEEQREHAFLFCLDELERLYRSAGRIPPPWINRLRERSSKPQSQPGRSDTTHA